MGGGGGRGGGGCGIGNGSVVYLLPPHRVERVKADDSMYKK